jgi:hypothetical protein
MSNDSEQQSKQAIPTLTVFFWTVPWLGLLLVLLALPALGTVRIPYALYATTRQVALLILIALAIIGLLRAFKLVGWHKEKSWYTVGFLVALVLFWGLFPPSWFFTEYYLFDTGTIELRPDVQRALEVAADEEAKAKIRDTFMSSVKTYADMASKVWVAVGAALATAIGFSKRGS